MRCLLKACSAFDEEIGFPCMASSCGFTNKCQVWATSSQSRSTAMFFLMLPARSLDASTALIIDRDTRIPRLQTTIIAAL
jgi:hypothetical protein